MADPVSICASVVAIAGAGIKLSTTLYTYSETAFHADRALKDTARDVSLTSAVLNELGGLLEQDAGSRLCSSTALKTAGQAVDDCREVFRSIEGELSKALRKGKDGKVGVSKLQSLKWPFMEPKIRLLRGNLERLKTSLLLMLNVLSYARKLATEQIDEAAARDEKQRIKELIIRDRESTRNWQEIQRQLTGTTLNSSTPEHPDGDVEQEPHTSRTEGKYRTSGHLSSGGSTLTTNSIQLSAVAIPGNFSQSQPGNRIGSNTAPAHSQSLLRCLCGAVPVFSNSGEPITSSFGFHISGMALDLCSIHIKHFLSEIKSSKDIVLHRFPVIATETPTRQIPGGRLSPCELVESAYCNIFHAFNDFLNHPAALESHTIRALLSHYRLKYAMHKSHLTTAAGGNDVDVPLTSATYIPGGESFGPGIGISNSNLGQPYKTQLYSAPRDKAVESHRDDGSASVAMPDASPHPTLRDRRTFESYEVIRGNLPDVANLPSRTAASGYKSDESQISASSKSRPIISDRIVPFKNPRYMSELRQPAKVVTPQCDEDEDDTNPEGDLVLLDVGYTSAYPSPIPGPSDVDLRSSDYSTEPGKEESTLFPARETRDASREPSSAKSPLHRGSEEEPVRVMKKRRYGKALALQPAQRRDALPLEIDTTNLNEQEQETRSHPRARVIQEEMEASHPRMVPRGSKRPSHRGGATRGGSKLSNSRDPQVYCDLPPPPVHKGTTVVTLAGYSVRQVSPDTEVDELMREWTNLRE